VGADAALEWALISQQLSAELGHKWQGRWLLHGPTRVSVEKHMPE